MFNSYEELMAAVEERRTDTLTLELDLGGKYSQEYEDAKTELQQAKAMKTVMGEQQFLADNLATLEERVAALKPEPVSVWVRYSRISLAEWSALIKTQGLTYIDQYERVLPKVFVGVYGQDPESEDVEPLTTDPEVVSSRSPKCLATGAMMQSIITTFMSWQNSGGEVSIRPTRSGQD